MAFSQPIPLSLYIHYPWCQQKCPYCDFNSHTAQNVDDQESAYLAALIQQLEATLPWIWGRPIESIFIGGGTPSLISVNGLNQLLSALRARLTWRPQTEITLEANPGAMETQKFAEFAKAGINRLSLGAQSFDPAVLKRLGRIHTPQDTRDAMAAARAAGFQRINLDVMFALPQQSLAQAQADIQAALALAPDHVSYYQLTLEPNTPFYRNPPSLPDEDQAWWMQQAGHDQLQQAGFEQYEVSAFAKKAQAHDIDQHCRHNLNYWQYGDYVGLGAGAHGKLTRMDTGEVWRTQMPASPGGYVRVCQGLRPSSEGALPGRVTQVSASERVFEFMLNVLRLNQGFDLALFQQRTGLSSERIRPILADWISQDWLQVDAGPMCAESATETETQTYVLTPLGQRYLNTVLSTLL